MNREEYYASLQTYKDNYLEHHGILGQKWGIRRFQKEDGSYTAAGKRRYGINENGKEPTARQYQKRLNDIDKAIAYNKGDLSKARSKQRNQEFRVNKLKAKAEKYAGTKKGDKLNSKVEKQEQKAKKLRSNANKYYNNIKNGQKETAEIINRIEKSGLYNMSSRGTLRSAMKFSETLGKYLLVDALSGGRIGYIETAHTTGTKYYVRDKK